jgi:hypothetical protein
VEEAVTTRAKSLWTALGGWRGAVAIPIFAAAGALHVYAVKPAEQRLAALELSIDKRTEKAAAPLSRLKGQTELAGRLGQFYAYFDGELSYVDWLARFYDVAERTGVNVQRVDYRTVEPAGIPLILHEVSVPITADYARVRAFSEGVLNAVPIASLDQITFRRQRANQAEVEADLRFSFYLPKK